MELTAADIGRHLIWLDVEVRVAELLSINPADETEVWIRPASGGRKWVSRDVLHPIPAGSHPGFADTLTDYNRLQRRVRGLLAAIDDPPEQYRRYANDLSESLMAAIAELRAEMETVDPLHDPAVAELPPRVDRYGRVHSGPVDDEGRPVPVPIEQSEPASGDFPCCG